MNFFGHAVVATWAPSSSGFVLGAMVPDFATMIGARVPGASDPDLAAGVALHHATDRVFHDAPTFRSLQAEARRELRQLGVPRPSALAVAHIGVEILLDGVLAEDPGARESYLGALHEGHPEGLGRHIRWGAADDGERYEALRRILVERASSSQNDPDAMAWRIARALSGRPRLRLDPDGEARVRSWAHLAAPLVRDRCPDLMGELRAGLSPNYPPWRAD